MRIYECYEGIFYCNAVQASSELAIPLKHIEYSLNTGNAIRYYSQGYKFIYESNIHQYTDKQ